MKCLHPGCDREASIARQNSGRGKAGLKCRGLCWTCYWDKSIRALYPSASKFAPRFDRADMTAAELDALIAQQMKTMPSEHRGERRSANGESVWAKRKRKKR